MTRLARKAELHPSTVWRLNKGQTRQGWITTNEKLVAALVAEETRVREHLAQVPMPDREDAA